MERNFSYTERVDLPFAAAVHILRDEPAVLLGLARDAAVELANRHEAAPHVMTPAPTPDVEHDIEMVLGEVKVVDEHAIALPLSWTAVDGARWFPSVTAEIEVTDLDHTTPTCEVSFFGDYVPRLGIVGAVLDATATHRLVEDTLQHFLVEACRRLVETAKSEGLAD